MGIALPLLVLLLITTLAIIAFGYFVPQTNLFGKTWHSATPDKGLRIALTFDDGPNEPYTTQLLDILAKHQVPATFFVVGENVKRHPDVVRRIMQDGHLIANHSYSHPPNGSLTNRLTREIDRCQQELYGLLGLKPRFVRFPYGRKTPWSLAAMRQRRLIPVMWSISANDPRGVQAQEITARIVRKARPGGIILLHDGNGTIPGADRTQTVKSIPRIISTLRDRSYTFVTVAELFGTRPYLD